MSVRLLLLGALLGCFAISASADSKSYTLRGDSSVEFPTDGTILRPNSVFGTALIDDPGSGAPILNWLEISIYWEELVGGSGVSTKQLSLSQKITAAPNQTGSGSTATSIAWGALTGFTSTGFLTCRTIDCYGVPCGPGESPGNDCVPFVGFEGVGPSPPLASGSFDSDPWVFASDMLSFDASPIEYVNLAGGQVTSSMVWNGLLTTVPVWPLAGSLVAGTGLLVIGLRALARRR